MRTKVAHTEEEWLEILGSERYEVMRRKGTEPPGSGEYCEIKAPGLYRCAACATELFLSEAKFESGTGWPSFFGPVDESLVRLEDDHSVGMRRTEVLCATCDSHLGHVFEDGPPPTGLRYCINSLALELERETDNAETPSPARAEAFAPGSAAPMSVRAGVRPRRLVEGGGGDT